MCWGSETGLARTINLSFWDRKGFVPGGQVGPGKALRRARGISKDYERIDCPM